MHKTTARLFGVLFTVVLAVAACGGDADTNTNTSPDGDPAEGSNADPVDDIAADSDTGQAAEPDDASCAADGDDCMVMLDGGDDGEHHHGEGIEVPDAMAVPEITIELTADPSSGQNLHVTLANFIVAPERASTDPVDGEGHMHLYVDGERVMRFYNQWLHLDLEPGSHTVMVELSANNHSAYLRGGDPIRAAVDIEVPEGEALHSHAEVHNVDAVDAPGVVVEVSEDPKSGWNVVATLDGFSLTPANASADHVAGEGHLHLFVDGIRVTRLYGPWWHLSELTEGDHEISVEFATNDHRSYAVNGIAVSGSVTVSVAADRASEPAESEGDHNHGDHDEPGDHEDEPEPGNDVGTAIRIDFDGGDVSVADDRISIDRGDEVRLHITSDVAEHVHVHGYDIFVDVSAGETVTVTFVADVPGVFEVEFEDSFTFVTELQVS